MTAGSEQSGEAFDDPAPSREPADTGQLPYAVFDDLTDIIVVLDERFEIVYANRFTTTILGYDHDGLVGRSITEFLHADDIARALEVVGLMNEDEAGVPITPALYDIRHAEGRTIPIELNGVTTAGHALTGHTLVIGRYSGDHALQNTILEMITTGSPDAELIAVVPRFGSWRHPSEEYAVLYTDVSGTDQVTGTSLAVDLVQRHPGGETPWAVARRTDGEVLADHESLPEVLRDDPAARGLGACWAIPVPDPLEDHPAVLIGWSRTDGPPASVHRYALGIMGRVLTLILQWRRQREELERAARHDPLTAVRNRAGFFEALDDALGCATDESMVGLLYVDLDGFKVVNDRHGHAVGDDVLRIVAARLATAVRRDDLIGRLGGDEFAALCPSVTDTDALTAVADRIIEDIRRPISVRGIEIQVGASIGIATASVHVEPDQLVDAADRSLYRAKAAGRGRWHVADPT